MYKEIWTVGRILRWTEQYFQNKETESPRLDGEVLLSHVLGKDRIYLYTHYDQPLVQSELDAFRELVVARGKGRSVAALTGKKEFMGLTFSVNDAVLIPRSDTETLVEYVLSQYDKDDSLRILDVCTGPGTILLSLLHYLERAQGVGLDISGPALSVADRNRRDFLLEERCFLYESDMFSRLQGHDERFDLIVSNPPYITAEAMKQLPADVMAEPHEALYGGEDGLDFYRILAKQCGSYLKDYGMVAFEVGYDQAEAVGRLLAEAETYENIHCIKDLSGIDRVVTARYKER